MLESFTQFTIPFVQNGSLLSVLSFIFKK